MLFVRYALALLPVSRSIIILCITQSGCKRVRHHSATITESLQIEHHEQSREEKLFT